VRSFGTLFVLALLIMLGIAVREVGGGDAAPVVMFCIALPLLFIGSGAGRTPLNPALVVLMVALAVATAIAAAAALWFAGPIATAVLLLVLGVTSAFAWRHERTIRLRTAEGHCPKCGYDVRATPDRCPECGEPTPSDTARRQRLREEIAAARAAREDPFVVRTTADNPPVSADPVVESPPENLGGTAASKRT